MKGARVLAAVALSMLVLVVACRPTAVPTPTSVLPTPTDTLPPATASPTPSPTATTEPSPTPSPTGEPTPTLPPGPEFACIPADAPRWEARVLQVIDGDTIRVFLNRQVFTVRYLGIDTPEVTRGRKPAHPWGPAATRRNRELVGGKRVLLVADPTANDRGYYGRLLRYIIVDGIFVNRVLLEEGLAWVYPAPHACEEDFLRAEWEARKARRGLWSRATPTPVTPAP